MNPSSVSAPPRTKVSRLTHPSFEDSSRSTELMNRIQQLLSENRWEDAGVLLNRHPTLFQHHPDITLTLCRLEERHLEDLLLTLRPEVCLPSVRLERMNLRRAPSMQQLIGRQGVTKLDLHECALSAEAWKGLAEGAEQTQRQHLPGLRAFSFHAPFVGLSWEPDVTEGLSCFLDHLDHLDDLALGRVRFSISSVFVSMKGKVERLTLSHMHAESFGYTMGERIASPDVKTLRLCHWRELRGKTDEYGLDVALRALAGWNKELADIEWNSMQGNVTTGKRLGKILAGRDAPLTVKLVPQEDELRGYGIPPFYSQLAFLEALGHPPNSHASKPLLDLHMVWHGDWAPPLHNALACKALKQERETVMAIPSLRNLDLTRPDGSDMRPHVEQPDGTLQAGYVTTWSRFLNAQLIAEAQVHFLKRFSLPGGTVHLPRDLTPALFDLAGEPHASGRTPDLARVTLVNRASYKLWVDSVTRAQTEMPPYFSRFVPELTRLPIDNS